VPVHDLLVHPREQDLIVGTYGRGMYIADVSVLPQIDGKALADDARVFDIEPRSYFSTSGWGNYDLYGDRHLTTPNEPNALSITYHLREAKERKVTITVADASKKVIRTLTGTSHQGLNTVRWDMRDGGGRVQPRGDYLVTVEIDGQSATRTARIRHPG